MRKIILLSYLILAVINISAQEDVSQESLSIERVITNEDLSKEKLRDKTKQWFAVTFNSSNDVIQLDTNDLIIGNTVSQHTIMQSTVAIPATFYYTINIKFKNGRCKIIVDNIYSEVSGYKTIVSNVTMNFEEWLLLYEDQISKMKDTDLKRMSEKTLKNKKLLKQSFESSVNVQKQIQNIAIKDANGFINSLETFLLEKPNDEW